MNSKELDFLGIFEGILWNFCYNFFKRELEEG